MLKYQNISNFRLFAYCETTKRRSFECKLLSNTSKIAQNATTFYPSSSKKRTRNQNRVTQPRITSNRTPHVRVHHFSHRLVPTLSRVRRFCHFLFQHERTMPVHAPFSTVQSLSILHIYIYTEGCSLLYTHIYIHNHPPGCFRLAFLRNVTAREEVIRSGVEFGSRDKGNPRVSKWRIISARTPWRGPPRWRFAGTQSPYQRN